MKIVSWSASVIRKSEKFNTSNFLMLFCSYVWSDAMGSLDKDLPSPTLAAYSWPWLFLETNPSIKPPLSPVNKISTDKNRFRCNTYKMGKTTEWPEIINHPNNQLLIRAVAWTSLWLDLRTLSAIWRTINSTCFMGCSSSLLKNNIAPDTNRTSFLGAFPSPMATDGHHLQGRGCRRYPSSPCCRIDCVGVGDRARGLLRAGYTEDHEDTLYRGRGSNNGYYPKFLDEETHYCCRFPIKGVEMVC